VPAVDEDLRHRPLAAGALDHGGALLLVTADVDLVVRDRVLLQEALGLNAEGTDGSSVDLDSRHATSLMTPSGSRKAALCGVVPE